MSGGIYWILIGLLAAALVAASVYDWRSRTIPNGLNAAIALLALPFWWVSGLSLWPDIALQVGIAGLVFVLFIGAFMIGQMGGGDVKLIGALALWLPPLAVIQLLVVMSLAGGVLTVAMIIPRLGRRGDRGTGSGGAAEAAVGEDRRGGGVLAAPTGFRQRLAEAAGQVEVPYGIAISFAGLWLISERFLNQFV